MTILGINKFDNTSPSNQASVAHLLSVGLLICRPGFESGRELSFLLKTLEIPKCWINVHNISGILGPWIQVLISRLGKLAAELASYLEKASSIENIFSSSY